MSKITYQNQDGTWGVNGIPITFVPKPLQGAIQKLRNYELTRLEPTEIFEMDKMYREKCKEVVELRKKLKEMECYETN